MIHLKIKNAPKASVKSDAFLDKKIIWKLPRNSSKPIAILGKICYNWINPK